MEVSHKLEMPLADNNSSCKLRCLEVCSITIQGEFISLLNASQSNITLFESIRMFCGTDSVMHNIPHIQHEWWNIPWNIVSPTKYCYGYE